MGFLIGPNVAYLLIIAAVTLFMLTINNAKSSLAMAGMALCLVAAGYELIYLRGNPWALLVVGLSPLPSIEAIRTDLRPAARWVCKEYFVRQRVGKDIAVRTIMLEHWP